MNHATNHPIKRSSILVLQAVLVLIGIAAVTLLLLEPQLEGRNEQASFVQIYLQDPFLAYVYVASLPFFVALFQAFKLLGLIGRDQVFTQSAVRILKNIKYCAYITVGTIVAAILYLKLAAFSNGEDAAGAVMLGNIAAFASLVIGTAASVFEKILQSATNLQSENDLTV